MLRSFILMVIAVFVSVSSSRAETIKLVNGVFMKGTVQDVTDEKVIFLTRFGKTVDYAFFDIDSIDGINILEFQKQFQSPAGGEAVVEAEAEKNLKAVQKKEESLKSLKPRFLLLTPEEQGVSELVPQLEDDRWDQWRAQISPYHVTIEKIVRAANQDFEALRAQGMEAADEAEVLRHIASFRKRLQKRIRQIEGIKPPPLLEKYHQQILDHLQFLDQSQEQLTAMNFHRASANLKSSQEAYSEAMVILRDIFAGQGAPDSVIDEIDFTLSRYLVSTGLSARGTR